MRDAPRAISPAQILAGRSRLIRKLLLVASEPREFSGILRRATGVAGLQWPVWFARRAELNGVALLMVANGPGTRLAGDAVEFALYEARPDGVLSIGFCGAVDPALKPGDIVVAAEVADGAATWKTAPPAVPGRNFYSGRVVTLDRVAGLEEKRALAGRALAVNMEDAAVAERAARLGVPFCSIRAVMDGAGQDFFLDFNKLRDSSGRFSRGLILKAALAQPRRALPELIRLERQGRIAARALGEFIADCRF
jgi:adenosylhomocysteine nucleosidase